MDKETLNEYGITVVTAIIAALLLLALTGSTFLNEVRATMDEVVPEHEFVEYANNEAFRALAERASVEQETNESFQTPAEEGNGISE